MSQLIAMAVFCPCNFYIARTCKHNSDSYRSQLRIYSNYPTYNRCYNWFCIDSIFTRFWISPSYK